MSEETLIVGVDPSLGISMLIDRLLQLAEKVLSIESANSSSVFETLLMASLNDTFVILIQSFLRISILQHHVGIVR